MIEYTIRFTNKLNARPKDQGPVITKDFVLKVAADKALEAFAHVEGYAEEGDRITITRDSGVVGYDRDYYPESYDLTVLTGEVKTRYNKRGYDWKGNKYANTDDTGEVIA